MIADVITYLNNRIGVLGYFEKSLCLVDKIEREGKVYPAQYNTNNEYKEINLDSFGSISYWRKNGDVSFDKSNSDTSIGNQYTATIPFKLVGFKKKEDNTNDQYLADNLCLSLISNLTVNNSALKQMLKAKKATFTAKKTVTDPIQVAKDEYDNIEFKARYTHVYFSIDFELVFITNSQCYTDICDNLPFEWGFVTVTDGDEEIQVQCGSAYTCTNGGTGGSATVENSDQTYSESVNAGDTLVLPDQSIDVYLDGVLVNTVTYPAMTEPNIDIVWQ